MRYVILRDDDTNALTPVECLERLYRPFLERNLPVSLAVIPDVSMDVRMSDGRREGFLRGKNGQPAKTLPIGGNEKLVQYLRGNPGYRVLQHGCHHDYFEFDRDERVEIMRRLDHGTRLLTHAGFPRPQTFVAPYDKLSRVSLEEVAGRFRVLSTGWFEWRRLPASWWPRYAMKKMLKRPHWRVESTLLLTHPGCLLSCHRTYGGMLDSIKETINGRTLTVLVTHWWEYFRDNEPDEAFIAVLHQTVDYLAREAGIRVISFDDVTSDMLVD